MAFPSAYPTVLDTFPTNKTEGTVQAGDHPGTHNWLADAVNKIELEMGINPSDIFGSIRERLDNIVTTKFNAAGGSISGDVTLAEGVDLAAGTTTGSMVGTGATQKLGFWGATPVVRPAAYTPTGATADRAYAKKVYAITNAAADRTLDSNLTSLDEMADVVGTLASDFNELQDFILTLVADLKTIGVLG